MRRSITPLVAEARETGLLAVEMEAAALYAFAAARRRSVVCVAHVTNQMGQIECDFEKGAANGAVASLGVVVSIARNWLRRESPEKYDRERIPLQWATTLNNLGNALVRLGEGDGDTARLEEAVAAYRAALEERTRERVSLDWAAKQNNLANALANLGEREGGMARLEEAVAAHRAALEECTRDRVPLQWAMTQNNLGHALARIGERENRTTRLKEAVQAFRAALEELTSERVPLDWAQTQNNLGFALFKLGERERGTARLEEAVKAYHAATGEWTRERAPFEWAMAQNNLGAALRRLAIWNVKRQVHVGEVLYGNVGAADRLDFTVIGRAVNEVVRIEKLCERLNRQILFSSRFAEAAGRCDGRLESLGQFELRGVGEPKEIFGPRLPPNRRFATRRCDL